MHCLDSTKPQELLSVNIHLCYEASCSSHTRMVHGYVCSKIQPGNLVIILTEPRTRFHTCVVLQVSMASSVLIIVCGLRELLCGVKSKQL